MDIWGGALGTIFRQSLLFASAVWIGCTIGGVALIPGVMLGGGAMGERFYQMVLVAPMFLFSLWGIPNLFLLLSGLVYFIRSENAAYGAWIGLAGIESLVVMLGWAQDFAHGWLALSAVWTSWLVLLAMAATGVYFLRQWQINRWAHHLARIEAENAARRAAREAAGGVNSSREEPSR